MHSRLAPSASERWLYCAGSPDAEAAYPNETSIFAAQGTALHRVAAMCLQFDLDPLDFQGKNWDIDGHKFDLKKSDLESMRPGLEQLDKYKDKFVELWVEVPELGTDHNGDPQGGTVDVGFYDPYQNRITVWDWKFGEGVKVDHVEQSQTMIYAIGFWHFIRQIHEIETPKFAIHIEMPRYDNAGGWYYYDYEKFNSFRNFVEHRAQETITNPVRTPGDYCGWCRAKGNCQALTDQMLSLFGTTVNDIQMGSLTNEQKAKIVLKQTLINKWMKAIHSELFADAINGKPTPGVKLTYGKSPARSWADEGAASQVLKTLLGEEAYSKKLISPTQAEEHLGKDLYSEVAKYVDKGKKPLVLVAEDSNKPAVNLDLFPKEEKDG